MTRSPRRVKLVLLDIIMPVMNGIELLKAVKVRGRRPANGKIQLTVKP